MYLRIEKEFKKRSKHRKTQLRFVVGAFTFATILSLLFSSNLFAMVKNNKLDANYIWFTLLGMLPFLFICYIYMAISIRKYTKLSIKNIFDLDFVQEQYKEMIHKEDLKILCEILKDNHINTRPKVQETIRHYQCLLPRKVSTSGTLLSILAFTVSTLALIFSESVWNSATTLAIVFVLVLAVILIYGVIIMIDKFYFKALGNDALYTRLEASLSEIFMDYYLKDEEKKTNQAVAEVN